MARAKPGFYENCWRVYGTGRSRVSHLLKPDSRPDTSLKAVCGKLPSLSIGWLGTATDAGWAHAASLPLCKRCRELSGRT